MNDSCARQSPLCLPAVPCKAMGISHGTKCQLGMSAQIEPRTKKGDTENCVPSGFESAAWPLALVVQAVANQVGRQQSQDQVACFFRQGVA